MSGIRDRYLATLVSGYGLMALQIGISLAMVPMALSYLGKETFGIWSLAVQVSILLSLLDAGMNGALARHLIDYREHPGDDGLRHCIGTGFRVLSIQGILIFIAAVLVSRFSGPAFGLVRDEAADFGKVLMMLALASCVGFFAKIFSSWLYATQRLELCNYITFGITIGEFAVFWMLLKAGQGIYSIAWARMLASIFGSLLICWMAIKIADFPVRMLKGEWNVPMFRRLASFGGGMFLLTLGTQMLTMTQTAMITKSLGLGTAAVWVTAPKLFQVILQMVSKLWDYRIPHLSALMAGNQTAVLTHNFCGLFRATAYIGGGGLGAVVALNPQFLAIWTHNEIHWDHINDSLIALVFYFSLQIRCITDFVLHTKKVGWMPILMLSEGILFVASALWMLPRFGIPGMLVAALVSGGILRLPYAWRHFRDFLRLGAGTQLQLAMHAFGGVFLGCSIYLLLSTVDTHFKMQNEWLNLTKQSTLCVLLLGPLALKLVIASQRTVNS
jgi:O-antigen/teichoic acid export membrane protein